MSLKYKHSTSVTHPKAYPNVKRCQTSKQLHQSSLTSNVQHAVPNYFVNRNFHPETTHQISSSSFSSHSTSPCLSTSQSQSLSSSSSLICPPNPNPNPNQHNIMFDSRVIRGNTFALPILTKDQQRVWKQQIRHYNRKKQSALVNQNHPSSSFIPSTQSNIEIQTDNLLLEELPHPYTHNDIPPSPPMRSTQTSNSILFQPHTHTHTPPLITKEKSTQIDPFDVEDFFDVWIEPTIQTLVSKVFQWTKLELAREEEEDRLASIQTMMKNKMQISRNASNMRKVERKEDWNVRYMVMKQMMHDEGGIPILSAEKMIVKINIILVAAPWIQDVFQTSLRTISLHG